MPCRYATPVAADDYVPDEKFPIARRKRRLDTMPEQQEAQPDWDGWNKWADNRVAEALDRFSEEYSKTVIELTFGRMDKHREMALTEISQLKTELAELRGEVSLLRELLKGSNVKDITPAIRKDIA
jgi:hypothetical protein